MKQFIITLSVLFVWAHANAQNLRFTAASPQPGLVEIYGGSSASGDIDGDGDMDLIMTGITPGRETALYLNDGTGNFTRVENAPFPKASNGLVIFNDLDGDGDLDLFMSGAALTIQEFTHIYLNDGTGGFTQLANPMLPQFQDSGVGIADVDGDGDPDLLICVKDKTGAFMADLFLNDGMAVFTPAGSSAFTPVQLGNVAFIDVENDGDPDVVISGKEENEAGTTTLYLNDGTGNYAASDRSDFAQMDAADVDAADVDQDGDLDILISGSSSALGVRTILYLNDGTGQFTELSSANMQNTFAGTNVISDLDNDGDLDLVIIGSQNGGLPNIYNIIYENRGNNVFEPVDTVGGEYIAACTVNDFNGDGLADIIIQGFADKTNVYWNTSILTSINDFANASPLNVFPNPSSGSVTVYLERELPGLTLSIFNIMGQRVYEQPYASGARNEVQLDLKAGTYVVVLRSGGDLVARKLLVME